MNTKDIVVDGYYEVSWSGLPMKVYHVGSIVDNLVMCQVYDKYGKPYEVGWSNVVTVMMADLAKAAQRRVQKQK